MWDAVTSLSLRKLLKDKNFSICADRDEKTVVKNEKEELYIEKSDLIKNNKLPVEIFNQRYISIVKITSIF